MKRKSSLTIEIKDPKALDIVNLLSKNKGDLDYSMNNKGIKIQSLNDAGDKVVVEIMGLATDWNLK